MGEDEIRDKRAPGRVKTGRDLSKICNAIIENGLIFLILFTPLAIGTVHVWAYTLMELTVFFLILVWLFKLVFAESFQQKPVTENQKESFGLQPQGSSFRFVRTPLNLPLLLFLCLILFQMVPLPPSVIKHLSPNTYKIYAKSYPESVVDLESPDVISDDYISKDYRGWRPLTIYRHATKNALFKMFAYIAVFLLITNNLTTRRQIKRVVLAIIVTGAIVAFFGIFQMVSGTDKIYWFWQSKYKIRSYFGPYVNSNHFAGYMELAIPLALGFLLMKLLNYPVAPGANWRQRLLSIESYFSKNGLLIFFIVIMASTLFLSLSRAGIISFLVSSVFFFIILGLKRSQKKKRKIVMSVMGLIFVFLIWMGIDPILKELSTLSRYQTASPLRPLVWRDTLNMAWDHNLFGVGLGNFQYLYPKYNTVKARAFWDHAHNDYLEMLSDTGSLGFLLFFGGIIFFLVKIIKTWKERIDPFCVGITLGGLAGLVAILFHSVVEFNFQIPANAMLFFIVLGLTVAAVHMKTNRRIEYSLLPARTFSIRPKVSLVIFSIIIILISTLSVIAVRGYLGNRHFQISKLLKNHDDSFNRSLDYLTKAISLDPGNAAYHYELAQIYKKMRDKEWKKGKLILKEGKWVFDLGPQTFDLGYEALAEYQKAIDLNPSSSSYHLMLAWHYSTLDQLSKYSRQTAKGTNYLSLAHHHFRVGVSLAPASSYAHRLYGLWAFNQLTAKRFQLSSKSQILTSRIMDIALRHYRRAIELDPSLIKEALEKYSDFTQDYDQLKQIVPVTPEALSRLDLFYRSHFQNTKK